MVTLPLICHNIYHWKTGYEPKCFQISHKGCGFVSQMDPASAWLPLIASDGVLRMTVHNPQWWMTKLMAFITRKITVPKRSKVVYYGNAPHYFSPYLSLDNKHPLWWNAWKLKDCGN